MTDNIKNKDKFNDAIDYEPKFDNKFILSIRLPMETLQVVTVSLREGNKNRATMNDIITLLWDNRDNGSIIKRKHTNPYEHILISNKVDYSTSTGLYCTTHDVKVPCCIPLSC